MAVGRKRGRDASVGAVLGGAIGTLFALAVISLADCAGPGCTYERLIGVAGHAAGGAAVGAVLGLLVSGIGRLARRLRS